MVARKSKSNWSRYASTLTINLNKNLMNTAKQLERDVLKIVGDKLYETYTTNVELSYHARSRMGQQVEIENAYAKTQENKDGKRKHKKKLTYRHTNTFVNSIYVESTGNTVKIKIHDSPYSQDERTEGGSTTDVYKYLTEGTKGGGFYFHPSTEERFGGYNYPTPKHDFEEHTLNEMKSFIDTLAIDIKNDKYSGRKYYKKWR